MVQTKFSFSVASILTRYIPLLILTLTIFSCRDDEPLGIGRNILPDEELLEAGVDTFAVDFYTLEQEPFSTVRKSNFLLGQYNTPEFGQLNAEFFATYINTTTGFNFKDTLNEERVLGVKDLKILIKPNMYYGDSSLIDFDVFELVADIPEEANTDFVPDPSYYNPISLLDSEPEMIISIDSVAETNDKGDTTAWKINTALIGYEATLKKEFAEKFLNPILIEDSIYYKPSDFRKVFKGLYVKFKSKDPNAGISLVDVHPTSSKLILRTEEITSGATTAKTVENVFIFGQIVQDGKNFGGNSINIFSENFSSEILAVLDNTYDPSDKVYIQTLAGPWGGFRIPELDSRRHEPGSGEIIINKAELVFPYDIEGQDESYFPNLFGLLETDSTLIFDIQIGSYTAEHDTANDCYRLNIGNYVHSYWHDSLTYKNELIKIFPATGTQSNRFGFNAVWPERIILNGTSADNPPILRVFYSKLPE